MRSVSNAFRQALYAQETDEVAVYLLTVTHSDLEEPLLLSTDPTQRLSDDPVRYGTRSRGKSYSFVPITVVMPVEAEDTPSTASLEIDNTDLSLIKALRSISDAAKIKMEIVLASDPDTVEVTFPELTMVAFTYDDQKITFDLAVDALVSEPFPGNSFVPSVFRGLF